MKNIFKDWKKFDKMNEEEMRTYAKDMYSNMLIETWILYAYIFNILNVTGSWQYFITIWMR
jgi:hypothetical protein